MDSAPEDPASGSIRAIIQDSDVPGSDEIAHALKQVVQSDALAASRRIRDFLEYGARAAIAGRLELDQYEIADRVLGRHDFDPAIDAAVRKLATQARQKLDAYYKTEGLADRLIVTLPVRSYIPHFRYRVAPALHEHVGFPEQEIRTPETANACAGEVDRVEVLPTVGDVRVAGMFSVWFRRRLYWIGLSCLGLTVLISFIAAGRWAREGSAMATPLTIRTQKGELRGSGGTIARDAVRLGPKVEQGEEAAVSVRFAPEHPNQHAGLMLYDNVDRFVRLGSLFRNHAYLEFGIETDGNYQRPEANHTYDPLGQRGSLRWFAVRRNRSSVTAYVSSDGFQWQTYGEPLKESSGLSVPRAAVYAFNGQPDAPATEAVFPNWTVGLSFHNRPDGPFVASDFPTWRVTENCGQSTDARIAEGALQVTSLASGCPWTLARPVPDGDWAYSTLVDFVPVGASMAGLRLHGSAGTITLSRRELERGIIAVEMKGDNDVWMDDFAGKPPVFLRLSRARERIRASFSRDGIHYRFLPVEIPYEQIGSNAEIGIVSYAPSWAREGKNAQARFYFITQEISNSESLNPAGLDSRQRKSP